MKMHHVVFDSIVAVAVPAHNTLHARLGRTPRPNVNISSVGQSQ